MSAEMLKDEVATLILRSGMKPDSKMRCALIRTLTMRHGDLDRSMLRHAVERSLKELL